MVRQKNTVKNWKLNDFKLCTITTMIDSQKNHFIQNFLRNKVVGKK